MQAGSPAQTAFLEDNPIKQRDHYTAATKALEAAELNPDPNYLHEGKPYKYGSAWLFVEVPDEVLHYLHHNWNLVQQQQTMNLPVIVQVDLMWYEQLEQPVLIRMA
jgi:hypothetical protein